MRSADGAGPTHLRDYCSSPSLLKAIAFVFLVVFFITLSPVFRSDEYVSQLLDLNADW